MPRSSGRGGGFRGGRSARRGGRTQSNAGRSGRGRRSQGRPKGQVKDGKAVQYAITDKNGQTKYIGTTNNPRRRAVEHRESGKMKQGDKMQVQSRAISRQKAEQLEGGRLKGHRRETGSNPERNTTNDGRYHHRKR